MADIFGFPLYVANLKFEMMLLFLNVLEIKYTIKFSVELRASDSKLLIKKKNVIKYFKLGIRSFGIL